MKVEMNPGPKPSILKLSGQAQHTFKSICITGILIAEAKITLDNIGLTEKQERVGRIPDKIPGTIPTKFFEKPAGCPNDENRRKRDCGVKRLWRDIGGTVMSQLGDGSFS